MKTYLNSFFNKLKSKFASPSFRKKSAAIGIGILAGIIFIAMLASCRRSHNANSANNSSAPNGDLAPVISNHSSAPLTLSEYIDTYNSILRRTVSTYINTNVSDASYISCAKTLINKALKNPSTAQYNSASVYEKDSYGRAIVCLDVSAQNGFGGWVRTEYYVCIQSYNSDGTFTYSPSVPYIDKKSSYNLLVVANDFGEDPADEQLKNLLFDQDDFVRQEERVSISPFQTLECYKLAFDYGVQYAYVDNISKKVVSVMTTFKDNVANSDDCEKICVASIAALANTTFSSAKSNAANVIHFGSFAPASTSSFYAAGFVYDYERGIAVTSVSEDTYAGGLYWTPNNKETYYENLADKYFANQDFDNAIVFYKHAQIFGEKLNSAYYAKAEQQLANGNLDEAGSCFNLAGNYKDAAVRVLEVFYKAGQQHEKKKDYSAAIYSYSQAGDYSDAKTKYKECSFKQGEIDLENKNYLEAIACFEGAANYKKASEKHKEACYLYAEQQLLLGSIDSATTYFQKAGDYKDASTKILTYYYSKGISQLENKDYLGAAASFKEVMGYSDASTKYKEANYLYGEELLSQGQVETAKQYFLNAKGYSDADVRIQKHYYDLGNTSLKKGEYLTAVNHYKLAGNYSDSATKILECYYQYGNYQMALNYYTEGTTYLSMCRGYKDTDKILLSYYYGEAKKAFDKLIALYSTYDFTWRLTDAHTDTINKLTLCEGYNDSALLIKIAEKTYYAWNNIAEETRWKATLNKMSVACSGSQVTITQDQFLNGQSAKLNLNYDINKETFSADITRIFISSGLTDTICALLRLFTTIENTDDFHTKIADKTNWTISDGRGSISLSYGGYRITINATKGYYIDLKIDVGK